MTLRPLLLALASLALVLAGCSTGTLLTLNVEAAQFIADEDATLAIPVPTPTDESGLPGPITEYIPDANGFALADLGLTGDLVSGLERLAVTLGLDLTRSLATPDPAATGAIALEVTLYLVESGQPVASGTEVASDSVSLSLGGSGTLDLAFELSESANPTAFAIASAGGAALGVELVLTSSAVTPGGVNEVNVEALLSTVDLSITTSLESVLGTFN